MNLLLWLLVAALGAFLFDRLMLAAEARGWIYWRKKRGSHGMPASAFLEVQRIFEPSKKYVLEVQEQEPEADEEGDPPTAGDGRHEREEDRQ